MVVLVFALGRPGSGKSTAARHLVELAEQQNVFAERIGDYKILYRMYKDDLAHKQFRPTAPYDGFDVIDFSVLDEALDELKRTIEDKVALGEKQGVQIIIVEFARSHYRAALARLGPELLKGAYFIYVDADVESCKERIQERVKTWVKKPESSDDHYISPTIMDTYYAEDDGLSLGYFLEQEGIISSDHFYLIRNHSREDHFTENMRAVVKILVNAVLARVK